jgi:hypothetical protein
MVARWSVRACVVVLLATLGVEGCGSSSSSGAKSADDAAGDKRGDDGEVTDDEAAAMASIEEYLAGEGEDGTPTGEGKEEDEDAAKATTAAPQGGAVARRDQLWALVKAKRPAVADCYRAAKKEDPKIGTKIAVRFVLKPDGTLKRDPEIVEDMTDISHTVMRQCTIEVLKSIEYPPHPNGMETTFTYPFGF